MRPSRKRIVPALRARVRTGCGCPRRGRAAKDRAVRRGLVLALLLVGARALAAEPTLVALTDSRNAPRLPRGPSRRGARASKPSGVADRLVGIDVRPADGRLYGLTAASELYRLDPATGPRSSVATLTVPFDGAARSGVDFNPQADRLRLVSTDGQNVRVHPTLGATAVDRPLTWKPGDPNAGRAPRVTAAAYSANVAGAAETKLFVIDAERDVLALQEPPNDGVLATVGPLGVDFGPLGRLRHPDRRRRAGPRLGSLGDRALCRGPRHGGGPAARRDRGRRRRRRLARRPGDPVVHPDAPATRSKVVSRGEIPAGMVAARRPAAHAGRPRPRPTRS